MLKLTTKTHGIKDVQGSCTQMDSMIQGSNQYRYPLKQHPKVAYKLYYYMGVPLVKVQRRRMSKLPRHDTELLSVLAPLRIQAY